MGGAVSVGASRPLTVSALVTSTGLKTARNNSNNNHNHTSNSSASVDKRNLFFPKVDLYTQSVCEATWMNVITFSGIDVFCDKFFSLLAEDTSDEGSMLALFVPKRANTSRTTMLLVLITFLLTLSDETAKTKKKLIKLGKIHSKHGVTVSHIRLFNQVLMRTFAEMPSVGECGESMRLWSDVLDFCAEEMYP
jgi:hypothetical protein